MSVARGSALILFGLLLTSCSTTPTAPSTTGAVPPSATAGAAATVTAADTGVLIPPGITITPPRALGVTRFVAFGDSITWGATSAWFSANMFYAAANGGYPERLAANLTIGHTPQPITMFNEGQPGELATGALTRFRTMLTTRRPGAVLLLEGINDISNDISVSRTAGALRGLLDAAAAQGVPVLLATQYQTYEVVDPDGHFRSNGAPYVPALNAEIRTLVLGRPNVFLVDLEPVMGNRALVGKDGIHLEDAGFDVMAARFQAVIDAVFPVRGSFQ